MIEIAALYIVISVIVLLIIGGCFSAAETGLTAVSRAKIHQLKLEGHKGAKRVTKLREEKDKLIGAILLGNNTVNIAASALATSLAIKYLGDEGVAYATIIMTLLVLIFGEVLPKTYAFSHAEKVALFVAPVFVVLVKVLSPITLAIQTLVDSVMRLCGVATSPDSEVEGTDALRGAIALHHDEGAVVKEDRDMLGSILDLGDTEVGEVMIHRKHMEAIDVGQSNRKIIDTILKSVYTRIPLWENEPDNIIGILHAKDLLRALQQKGDEKLDIRKIASTPWFVPETTSLTDQLHAFRERKAHFALVVDEYGGLLGLITLEDIIEEIVGQIEDEYDPKARTLLKQPDGSYVIHGMMTLRDINRELDWELPDDDASTIAGLIIHEAQLIPEEGQSFRFHGFRFKILKKQRNQLISIRVAPETTQNG